jgi:hypothetical protein
MQAMCLRRYPFGGILATAAAAAARQALKANISSNLHVIDAIHLSWS